MKLAKKNADLKASTDRRISSAPRYRHVVAIEYRDKERPIEQKPALQDWPTINRAKAGAFIAAGHYIMHDATGDIKNVFLSVVDQNGTLVWDTNTRIKMQDFV